MFTSTRLPSRRGAGHVSSFPTRPKPCARHLSVSLSYSSSLPLSGLFVGLALREYLADRLQLDHARDMVGGVTGLVITLVALVFGLLIWTAFGVFSTQKTELQVMAANALEFNQETREYGPEAAHARALMRADWIRRQTTLGRRSGENGGYGGFNAQHG